MFIDKIPGHSFSNYLPNLACIDVWKPDFQLQVVFSEDLTANNEFDRELIKYGEGEVALRKDFCFLRLLGGKHLPPPYFIPIEAKIKAQVVLSHSLFLAY